MPIPSTGYDLNSVFTDPSTTTYQNYIVSASCSGSYEVDDVGRRNILWVANKIIGTQFDHGNFVLPEDSLKKRDYALYCCQYLSRLRK